MKLRRGKMTDMSDDLGSASAQLIALGPQPELEPLRTHMTVDEYEALVSMLERRCACYRQALRVIAGGIEGDRVLSDWELSNIARAALEREGSWP